MLRGFFVRHPLEASNGLPGHYPMASRAVLLHPDGTKETKEVDVLADAFSVRQAGPNMDPCIYSHPVPWCWSYCRLTSGGSFKNNLIVDGNSPGASVPTTRVLQQEVRPGDIIFFGNVGFRDVRTLAFLWIDTVLVVDSKERWKAIPEGRRYRLTQPPRHTEVGQISGSDAWRFHFADHLHGHRHVDYQQYHTFFGRMFDVGQTEPFSFVPVAPGRGPLRYDRDDLRGPLLDWVIPTFEGAKASLCDLFNNPDPPFRPLMLHEQHALSLWRAIKESSSSVVVQAHPLEVVQDGAVFRTQPTRRPPEET